MAKPASESSRATQGGRLAGKRTIVTGAGSGIGRASAKKFAAEGAMVLAVDRAKAAVEATVDEIARAGGKAIAVAADVGAEADVEAFISRAVEAFGGLDAVYANAGISGGLVPLAEQTVEHWQEVLRVNLIGAFLAIKHAAPLMVKQRAGVISLVQTAANSLYGTGVRVNAICPGLIETGMTQPIFERARERGTHERIGQLNPLTRYGNPEEIAAMAAFLASDEASYVNGQAIAVDGGLSSTHPFPLPRR